LVVGFAPAGGNDIAGRLLSRWLSERLGRQFVVENRAGRLGADVDRPRHLQKVTRTR
jgi:tripartite-type tricarboxylate transporter receptor subunit TctC